MGVVQNLPNSVRLNAVLDIENATPAVFQNEIAEINRLSFVAGESITTKDLLALGTDGKVYKASSLASNNKPVFGIAYNGGASGEVTQLYNDNEIIEYNLTFGIGKTIFLSSAGIPTTDYNYTVGNLYQRLGIAITANSFVIKIEESKEMR